MSNHQQHFSVTPTLEAITTNVGSSGIGILEQTLGSRPCSKSHNHHHSTSNSNKQQQQHLFSNPSIIITRIIPRETYHYSSAKNQQNNNNKESTRFYFNTVEFVDASASPSAPPVCTFYLLPQEGEVSTVSIFSVSASSLLSTIWAEKKNLSVNKPSSTKSAKKEDDTTSTDESSSEQNHQDSHVLFAFIGTTRGWHILLHLQSKFPLSSSSSSTTTSANNQPPPLLFNDDSLFSGQVLWMERKVSVTSVCTSAVAPYCKDGVVALLGTTAARTTFSTSGKALTNPALIVVHDCGLASVYLADQFIPFVAKMYVLTSSNSSSSNSHHHNCFFSVSDRLRIHQLPPDDVEIREFYASHSKFQIAPRVVVNLQANISELQQVRGLHRKFLTNSGVSTAVVSSCCLVPCGAAATTVGILSSKTHHHQHTNNISAAVKPNNKNDDTDENENVASSSSNPTTTQQHQHHHQKLFKLHLWIASNTCGFVGTSILIDCSEATAGLSSLASLTNKILNGEEDLVDLSARMMNRNNNNNNDDDDDEDENENTNNKDSLLFEKKKGSSSRNRSNAFISNQQLPPDNNNNNSSTTSFRQKAIDTAIAVVAQTVFNSKAVADIIRMSSSAYNGDIISLSRAIDTYPSCPFTIGIPPPINDDQLMYSAKTEKSNENNSSSQTTSSSTTTIINMNTTPSIHPICLSESSTETTSSSSSCCCAIYFPYSDGRVFILVNDLVVRVLKGVRDSVIMWLKRTDDVNDDEQDNFSSSALLTVLNKRRQILEAYDVLCPPTRIPHQNATTTTVGEHKNSNSNNNNNTLRICARKLRKVLMKNNNHEDDDNMEDNDDDENNKKIFSYSDLFPSSKSSSEKGNLDDNKRREWEIIPRSTSIDGFGAVLCASILEKQKKNNFPFQQTQQFWFSLDSISLSTTKQDIDSQESEVKKFSSKNNNNNSKKSNNSRIFLVPTLALESTRQEIDLAVSSVLIAQQQQQSLQKSRTNFFTTNNNNNSSSSSSSSILSLFEELVLKTVESANELQQERTSSVAILRGRGRSGAIFENNQLDDEDDVIDPDFANGNNSNINENNSSIDLLKQLRSLLKKISDSFVKFHHQKNVQNNNSKKTAIAAATAATSSSSPSEYFEIMSKPEAKLLRKFLIILDSIVLIDIQQQQQQQQQQPKNNNEPSTTTTANFFVSSNANDDDNQDDDDDKQSVVSSSSTTSVNNTKNMNSLASIPKQSSSSLLFAPTNQLLSWSLGVAAGTQKIIGDPSSSSYHSSSNQKLISTSTDSRIDNALDTILRDVNHYSSGGAINNNNNNTSTSSASITNSPVLNLLREEILKISSSAMKRQQNNNTDDHHYVSKNSSLTPDGPWIRRTFQMNEENIKIYSPSSMNENGIASLEDVARLGQALFNSDNDDNNSNSKNNNFSENLKKIRHPTNAMLSSGIRTKEASFIFLTWICANEWSLRDVIERITIVTTMMTKTDDEKETKVSEKDDRDDDHQEMKNDDDQQQLCYKVNTSATNLNFKRLLTVIGACSWLDLRFLCLNCKNLNWSKFAKWICVLRIAFRLDSVNRNGSHLHPDARFEGGAQEVDFLCSFIRSVVALEKAEEYFSTSTQQNHHHQRQQKSNRNNSSLVPFLGHLASLGGNMTSFMASAVQHLMMRDNNNINNNEEEELKSEDFSLRPIHKCSHDLAHDDLHVWRWVGKVLGLSSKWSNLYHKSLISSSSSTTTQQTSSIFFSHTQLDQFQKQNSQVAAKDSSKKFFVLDQYKKLQNTVQISSLALFLLEKWDNNQNSSKEQKNTDENHQTNDANYLSDVYLTISHLLDATAKKATAVRNDDEDESNDGNESNNNQQTSSSPSPQEEEREMIKKSPFFQKDAFKDSLSEPATIDAVLIIHMSITSAYAALVRSILSKFWPSIVLAKSVETMHQVQSTNNNVAGNESTTSTSSNNQHHLQHQQHVNFYRRLSALLEVAEYCTSRLQYHLSRLLLVLDSDAAKEAAMKMLHMDDTRALASITIARFVSNDSSRSLPLASPSLIFELSAMSQLEDRAFLPLYQQNQNISSSSSTNSSSSSFLQQHLSQALQNSIRHVCEVDNNNNKDSKNNNNSSLTSPSALLRILAALRVMLKHASVFRAAARVTTTTTTSSTNTLTPSRLLLCFDDEQQQNSSKQEIKNRDDDDEDDDEASVSEKEQEEKIDHLLLQHERSPHIKILSEICHALGKYRNGKNNSSTTSVTMKISDYNAILEYDSAWRGGRNSSTTSSGSGSGEILSQSARYVWTYAMMQSLRTSSSSSSPTKNNDTIVELGQQDDLVLTDLIRKVGHKSVVAAILMRELRRRLKLVIGKLELVVERNNSSQQQQQQKAANDILLAIPIRVKQWAHNGNNNNSDGENDEETKFLTQHISISKVFLQRCYNLTARVVELRSGSLQATGTTNQKLHDQVKLARLVATTFQELATKMKH